MGTVICLAVSAMESGQKRPKTAAVILRSLAVNGTRVAVPMFRPK